MIYNARRTRCNRCFTGTTYANAMKGVESDPAFGRRIFFVLHTLRKHLRIIVSASLHFPVPRTDWNLLISCQISLNIVGFDGIFFFVIWKLKRVT